MSSRACQARLALSSGLVAAILALGSAIAQPLAVLEFRGRLMTPQSAAFALYQDGLVIFRVYESPTPSNYHWTRLSGRERQALLSRIAPEALAQLADEYDAVTATDPGANIIHVWPAGRRKTVLVSGDLHPLLEPNGRAKTPDAFLRAFDAMATFSAQGKPWLPASIEVFALPSNNLPEDVVPWPKRWQSPAGVPATRKGESRIVLPAKEFGRLTRFMEGSVQSAARTGEHRWVIRYRLPFPHEQMWNTGTE